MQEKIEYPKWLYLDGEARIVSDEAERRQYFEWGEAPGHTTKGEKVVQIIASGIPPKKRARKPKNS